jgi:mRNA degradation ribonuclease J1/J2
MCYYAGIATWSGKERISLDSSAFVEAIPLGGMGEFGMNMMALQCEDQILVIDSGLMS